MVRVIRGRRQQQTAAASPCGSGMSETVVGAAAEPTLGMFAAPVSADVATAIPASSLTATLGASSGTDDTNTITFTVFGPQSSAPTNCAGGRPSAPTPAGNGPSASSGSFTPSHTGDYWWLV